MLPSRLRYPVRIEKKTYSKSSIGEAQEVWTTLRDTKAEVKFLSSVLTNADGDRAFDLVEFTLRYRNDYDHSCRVVWEGKNYKVEEVEIIGFKEATKFRTVLIHG